jgi:hypothetical protein
MRDAQLSRILVNSNMGNSFTTSDTHISLTKIRNVQICFTYL